MLKSATLTVSSIRYPPVVYVKSKFHSFKHQISMSNVNSPSHSLNIRCPSVVYVNNSSKL
jgi:hypothetical protein